MRSLYHTTFSWCLEYGLLHDGHNSTHLPLVRNLTARSPQRGKATVFSGRQGQICCTRELCRRLEICNNDSAVFYPLRQRKVHFVQKQTECWDQTSNSHVIDWYNVSTNRDLFTGVTFSLATTTTTTSYMASSVSGQDESNPALWLATVSVHLKHAAKKELGQYLAILTEQAWSITHTYFFSLTISYLASEHLQSYYR